MFYRKMKDVGYVIELYLGLGPICVEPRVLNMGKL